MGKIIRVSGCHDCDKAQWFRDEQEYQCHLLSEDVTEYYRGKTLPDDCPLEDDKYAELLEEATEWCDD